MVDRSEDYKKLREAFVSDLIGGSLWEINQVTLIAPVSATCRILLQLTMTETCIE